MIFFFIKKIKKNKEKKKMSDLKIDHFSHFYFDLFIQNLYQ